MGTTARIGAVQDDGSVISISVAYDGYPTNAGAILKKHYSNAAAVAALLSLGNLSTIEASPAAPPGHTFNTPVDGHCIAYGRDRGEKRFANARADASPEGMVRRAADNGEQYVYLYRDGAWAGASMLHRRGEFFPIDELLVRFADA